METTAQAPVEPKKNKWFSYLIIISVIIGLAWLYNTRVPSDDIAQESTDTTKVEAPVISTVVATSTVVADTTKK